MNSIQELIENTANDPELAASIDIEKLLEASQENRFLGKSMETVTKDIIEVLGDPLLNLDKTEISDISSKLLGYQYIDRVCDVRVGRFIRWIKRCTRSPYVISRWNRYEYSSRRYRYENLMPE